jgi:release factor glutamine methyltransferase
METIDRAVREAARRLAASGVEDALRDARLLMRAVRGWDAATLFARQQEPLAPADAAAFAGLVARRRSREPVSRILGRREFWSLDLALGPATLDPRPDSETLVEAALAHAADPRRVLDLGTGSGCLLLATLSERPRAFGVGLDRSEGALRTARANAISLGFGGRSAFVLGDWTDMLGPGFDLVLANPPYIPAGEIAGLEPEVRGFDPAAALDGGADGLDAYRRIFADLGRILAPDGTALFEHGQGQDAAVAAIARGAGFDIIATPRDFSGVVRVCAVKRDWKQRR